MTRLRDSEGDEWALNADGETWNLVLSGVQLGFLGWDREEVESNFGPVIEIAETQGAGS